MKMLWVTNLPTPDITEKENLPINVGGGWLVQMSQELSKSDDLTILFRSPTNVPLGEIHGIHYASIPFFGSIEEITDSIKENLIEQMKRMNPDVIHIWGTEYLHTYLVVECCKELGILDRVVISIQGLTSVCKDYYFGYIEDPVIHVPTLKDQLHHTSIDEQFLFFTEAAKYEVLALQDAKNVIGRTNWDEMHTKEINPNLKYYLCNETLRESFYDAKWDFDACEKYRIFVSQGNYPIKGLHLALEGLSKLVQKYPYVKLYCTGPDRKDKSLYHILRETRYDRYIRKMIDQLHLNNHVFFTGYLDEQGMVEQYQKCHVFLSASSIENSSNSIGEAMLVGAPVVSSDVGGIRSLMEEGKKGLLYPANEIDQMVDAIDQIFSSKEFAQKLSENARRRARITHD